MGKAQLGVGSFVVGGLVGLAVGILFAPRSGAETREFIADTALDYWDRADEMYGDFSDRAVELYSTSKDAAVDATDQVKAKIDAARARLTNSVDAPVVDEAPVAEAAPEPMADEPKPAPKPAATPAPVPAPAKA